MSKLTKEMRFLKMRNKIVMVLFSFILSFIIVIPACNYDNQISTTEYTYDESPY